MNVICFNVIMQKATEETELVHGSVDKEKENEETSQEI